jgi:hypothetical protein
MRNLKRIATIAVIAAAILPLTVTPAMADLGDADKCPSDYVCMWEDNNYNGSMYVKYRDGSKTGNKYDIGGFNGDNEISAVVNNTGWLLVMYDNDNYTGSRACVRPYSKSANLGSSFGYDNEAESFKLEDLRLTC